jgi:hypothetical protein
LRVPTGKAKCARRVQSAILRRQLVWTSVNRDCPHSDGRRLAANYIRLLLGKAVVQDRRRTIRLQSAIGSDMAIDLHRYQCVEHVQGTDEYRTCLFPGANQKMVVNNDSFRGLVSRRTYLTELTVQEIDNKKKTTKKRCWTQVDANISSNVVLIESELLKYHIINKTP